VVLTGDLALMRLVDLFADEQTQTGSMHVWSLFRIAEEAVKINGTIAAVFQGRGQLHRF
jgi:hypothetical protein